ncbi:MAG: hypothetical protein HQ523_08415 [Lentisphaerae bacterium]|nr:hypothetical protein [Lentisphaerota bacterium]
MEKLPPTDEANRRRNRLIVVAVICFLALLPSLLAWLVNLDIALQVVAPAWQSLVGENPAGLLGALASLAGDYSTISTLVPVLLFAFPMIQAFRILRRPCDDRASIHAMRALPYPAHFPFFLVMLGLTGTLYGLWIGLSVSGVSGVAKGVPSAEDLPVVLERLLDGTATALLSSLLGLIGAFLAAKPFPFLFEQAACLDPIEEERSLAETIDHLTRDLKALSAASREFSTTLHPAAVTGVLEAIASMETAVTRQTEATEGSRGAIEAVEAAVSNQSETSQQTLQTMQRIEVAERESAVCLQKIDGIATVVSNTARCIDQMGVLCEKLIDTELGMADTLNRLLGEMQAERRESAVHLTALRGTIESEATDARSERTRLRKAFAAYVGGLARGDD